MSERLCLLAVHAHPDDESSKGAGTVAFYHDQGVRCVLVTCTGGEEGDILNPEMDRPEVRARLAEVRAAELDEASRIIGYDRVVRLGYRDSGMPGSPANFHHASFAMAPLEEAVGKLVRVIREERPQVLLTYPDEQSRYPHPDHLRVHEISLLAWEAAGDPSRFVEAGPPWQVAKLYYSVFSRGRVRAWHERLLELGLESPFAGPWLESDDAEERPITRIDVSTYEERRRRALRAHRSQVDPNDPRWFALQPAEAAKVWPWEEWVLARSTVEVSFPESDLFSGVVTGVVD